MKVNNDVFLWLQKWYQSQSNGIWEHGYGMSIETLDNPGWKVTIDLKGTLLEGVVLEVGLTDRSDDDWLHYKITGNQFVGACGPLNLSELISIFRDIHVSHESRNGFKGYNLNNLDQTLYEKNDDEK